MTAYRLQGVLQDLREQGAPVERMTADEIRMLVRACDRVDNPYAEVNAELCEQPVKVCDGLYLWPVTAGAQVWLTEYAERWWAKGSRMFRWAQIYALYNARNREAFVGLTERGAARAAVLKCVLRMCAHMDELVVAMNRCYGVHPDTVADEKDARADAGQAENFAHYVAMLEVHSGIPSKVWLWGRSLQTTIRTYYRMTALAAAFGGGKASEEMTFELNDALTNLARVKTAIIERIADSEQQNH